MYTYRVTGKGGLDNAGLPVDREFVTNYSGGGPVTLEVKVELLDFHPKSGSLIGGTLITLYGNNFVNDTARMGENVVKIGHTMGSLIDQYCYVEEIKSGVRTSSMGTHPIVGSLSFNSWLKCRVATDYARTPHLAEMILFASTFEEAVSNNINTEFDPLADHFYEFVDATLLPTLSTVSLAFDWLLVPNPCYVLTITGTGITDDITTFDTVKIGGLKQTVLSVTATEVKVEIDNLSEGLDTNSLEIYFSQGLANAGSLSYPLDITITP